MDAQPYDVRCISDEKSAAAEAYTTEAYLDRISAFASSVEDSSARVEQFIARCRGGGISKVDNGEAPRPSGHFAQLDRLGEAAAVLEKLTRELGSIG